MAGTAAKKTAAAKTAAAAVKPPTEKQVEAALAGDESKGPKDVDGVPVGDHLGGTAPQDAAAQQKENVEGHGDAPVTGATTAHQSRTNEGDNPEVGENAVPKDDGTIAVPGHQPFAPTAAPLERVKNPVYPLENLPEDTEQRLSDTEPVDASAVHPKAVREGQRLVGEDGKAVKIDKVFEDSDGPENFRVVADRVYIEEPLPGAKDLTTTRLLFPKGARVNVSDVARLKRQWA